MDEREKAIEAMENLVSNYFRCPIDKIEFGDLELGTTWVTGQDYSLSYNIIDTEIGSVCWSHVDQEAYL